MGMVELVLVVDEVVFVLSVVDVVFDSAKPTATSSDQAKTCINNILSRKLIQNARTQGTGIVCLTMTFGYGKTREQVKRHLEVGHSSKPNKGKDNPH